MAIKPYRRFKLATHTTNNSALLFCFIFLSYKRNSPLPSTHSFVKSTLCRFDLNFIIFFPQHDTFNFTGCRDFILAIQQHPLSPIIYTDGSNNPHFPYLPSGISAIISTRHLIAAIIVTCPKKGSYPAEMYSIFIFTKCPMQTLSWLLIFSIDNLTTCRTLNYIISCKSFRPHILRRPICTLVFFYLVHTKTTTRSPSLFSAKAMLTSRATKTPTPLLDGCYKITNTIPSTTSHLSPHPCLLPDL